MKYTVYLPGVTKQDNYYVSVPFGTVHIVGNPPQKVIDDFVCLGCQVFIKSKKQLTKLW